MTGRAAAYLLAVAGGLLMWWALLYPGEPTRARTWLLVLACLAWGTLLAVVLIL